MIDEQLFDKKLADVKEHFKTLMNSSPQAPEAIFAARTMLVKTSGVYVFSEQADSTECYMYVGQSNDILGRLHEHCGMGDRDKANFAYMLTVANTNLKPIQCSPNRTKRSMYDIPKFKEGFEFSLCRIKRMNCRWAAVADKLERNLLEIFSAVILGSRFNAFHS